MGDLLIFGLLCFQIAFNERLTSLMEHLLSFHQLSLFFFFFLLRPQHWLSNILLLLFLDNDTGPH